MADPVSVLGAAAAVLAASFAGMNLLMSDRRDRTKWAREALVEVLVNFLDQSFYMGRTSRVLLRARLDGAGADALERASNHFQQQDDEQKSALTRIRLLGNRRAVQAAEDLLNTDRLYFKSAQTALRGIDANDDRHVDILRHLGTILSSSGRYTAALSYLERALNIIRKRDLPLREGQVLIDLGVVNERLGHHEKSLTLYERALNILVLLGDAEGIQRATTNLGVLETKMGRYDDAVAHYEQSLAISRKVGDLLAEGVAMNNLSMVLSELGRQQESLEVATAAVEIRRRLYAADHTKPHALGLAAALSNLGNRLLEAGRLGQSLQIGNEAVKMYRNLTKANPRSFEPDYASSLNNLGTVLAMTGKLDDAVKAYQQAVDLYRKLAELEPTASGPISLLS
jgi:tetratricopeptide (TPR) repeat protein